MEKTKQCKSKKSKVGGEIEVRTVYSWALLRIVHIPVCTYIACINPYPANVENMVSS
jgi:serine protease inhibitor ecotin